MFRSIHKSRRRSTAKFRPLVERLSNRLVLTGFEVVDISINADLEMPNETVAPPTTWDSQRSMIDRVDITLDNTPVRVAPEDIRLINLGMDSTQEVATEIPLTEDNIQILDDTIRIELNGERIEDGVYRVALSSNIVNDVIETTPDFYEVDGTADNGLFQYTSDLNGDGAISVYDIASIAFWFGQKTNVAGGAPDFVDLNDDGGVSVFDVARLARAFGNSLTFADNMTPPVNNAPIANPDDFIWLPGIEMHVLENDSDADGDELSIVSYTTPVTAGTLTLNDNVFTFEPTDFSNNADEFSYVISDGNGATSTATVTLLIPFGEGGFFLDPC